MPWLFSFVYIIEIMWDYEEQGGFGNEVILRAAFVEMKVVICP
jgi:hypothetical protein